MKLRHLRMGITGHPQKPRTLATLPSGNRNPSHSPNRPRKPHLLEKPSKSKPKGSQVVCHTPRLQPHNQTHPRQTPCCPRYAVLTTKRRQGRRRQSRPHTLTRKNVRTTHHDPRNRMERDTATSDPDPKNVPATYPKMEDEILPNQEK